MPFRDKEIISTKTQAEEHYDFRFSVLFHCFIVWLSCPKALHNIFHTPVVQYKPVCAESAVKHQSTNQPLCYSARKLHAHECPYNIYSDGYSCGSHGSSSATCLVLKKWVFTTSREESLCADPRVLHFIFSQVS